MKHRNTASIALGVTLVVFAAGAAFAGDPPPAAPVGDDEIGLSKESVYATPEPIVPTSQAGDPGENKLEGAYFSESPPMIPHQIEDFLPIAAGENACLDCHDLKDSIGQERAVGDPTPLPESHYTDLRQEPAVVADEPIGARYVCVQCHAPQTDAAPLVESTYRQ